MRIAIVACFAGIVSIACEPGRNGHQPNPIPAGQGEDPSPTFTITLHQSRLASDKVTLWVERKAPTATPWSIKWYRNAEPVTDVATGAPLGTTQATAGIEQAVPSPLLDAVEEEQVWRVEASAYGKTATAAVTLSLRRECSSMSGAICSGLIAYDLALTSPVPTGQAAIKAMLETVVSERLLQSSRGADYVRFRNYVDLIYKKQFDADPLTPVLYDAASYGYLGSSTSPIDGGYEPGLAIDRTCLEYPLQGTVCFNGHVMDIDGEFSSISINYEPALSESSVLSDGAGGFNVWVGPGEGTIDLLFEPPADPLLMDVTDATAASPEKDLSNYVKLSAKLYVIFPNMLFRATPISGSMQLSLRLAAFDSTMRSSRELIYEFQRGPFCQNNLGTQDVTRGAAPFDSTGEPLYPGLISDAGWNTGYAQAFTSYNALDVGPYPHAASSVSGGSGAGRDSFGAYAMPYAYGENVQTASDNPNNCRRPADACTVAGVQDGGPDAGAPCQSPNISDDGDDATYRKSMSFSNPISFLH